MRIKRYINVINKFQSRGYCVLGSSAYNCNEIVVGSFHYLILSFSCSDKNFTESGEQKCFNKKHSVLTLGSQVPFAYPVMCRIQCNAKKNRHIKQNSMPLFTISMHGDQFHNKFRLHHILLIYSLYIVFKYLGI